MATLRKTISPNVMPRRPMELGKIKIGGKGKERPTRDGKGTWRAPTKFDHFVVTGRDRGDDGNFVRDGVVHEALGEEPKALDIRLLFDTLEESFQSGLVIYKGKKKVFECDGETANNLNSGVSSTCAKSQGKECPCKPYARFAVVLDVAADFGGFYLFRTTSWETINNLQTTLSLLENTFGSLRGLPLKLVVYPSEDTHDGGSSTSYKVGVVLRADYETTRQAALEFHRRDTIERHELKQLSSGLTEVMVQGDDGEAGHISEEFLLDPKERAEAKTEREIEEVTDKTATVAEEARDRLKEARKPAEPAPPREPPPQPKAQTEPPPKSTGKKAEGSTGGLSGEELARRRFFALWKDVAGDIDRGTWQKEHIGKVSATDFDEADFRKAADMLDSGVGLAPENAAPEPEPQEPTLELDQDEPGEAEGDDDLPF